jgi:MtN3 and saliva related transmembrane protein
MQQVAAERVPSTADSHGVRSSSPWRIVAEIAGAVRLGSVGRHDTSARRTGRDVWRPDGVSPVLQIQRMVVRKSSSDVSVGYFGILTGGFVLWLLYGLVIRNAPLIITNVVAMTAGLTTIAVARLYRSRDPQQV